MDSVLEMQHVERAARRAWRNDPVLREEYRHDLQMYVEHMAHRAGLRSRERRPAYVGADEGQCST